MGISKKTFVALDNMTKEQIQELFDKLPLSKLYGVKLGLEIFSRYGQDYVQKIASQTRGKIFLDLKLHDIPNTVSKTLEALAGTPINYLTVHLAGGKKMLQMAREANDKFLPQTTLLGVTYLTSLSNQDFADIWDVHSEEEKKAAFFRLLDVAFESNMRGLILSAGELDWVAEWENQRGIERKQKFLKVCPGIRFAEQIHSGQVQDQIRVYTPEEARKKGADLLVMGRSLTQNEQIPADFWSN